MHGGGIGACGARLMVDIDGASLALDLMLTRAKDTGSLVLRAGYENPSPSMLPVVKAVLRTGSLSTGDLFVAPGRFEENGTLILQAPATDSRIATLFQELMVGGGSVEIAREFMLAPDTIAIPGPLPQSVRAGYLACAGDLVGVRE